MRLMLSPAVRNSLKRRDFSCFMLQALRDHEYGSYGDVPEKIREMNKIVAHGGNGIIMSTHEFQEGKKVSIIRSLPHNVAIVFFEGEKPSNWCNLDLRLSASA